MTTEEELFANVAELYQLVYQVAQKVDGLAPSAAPEAIKSYGPTSYANLDAMTLDDICELMCKRFFNAESGPAGIKKRLTLGEKKYRVKIECLN